MAKAAGIGHLACTWAPPDRLRAAFAAIPEAGGAAVRRADGMAIPRYSLSSPVRAAAGRIDETAPYAGAGAGLVTRVEPAADIVRQLAAAIRAPTE